MTKRTRKGQFIKGVSGNPGGRPKTDTNLRELAREHTLDAIGTLVTIMHSKKAPAAARVSAAVAVLDRGYGRPVQAMQHEGEIALTESPKPLDVVRRIYHLADQIARELEKKRPDLCPIDRGSIAHRVMDEVLKGGKPLDAAKPDTKSGRKN